MKRWLSTRSLVYGSTGATVARNNVHDVVEERAFSAIGVLLAAANGGGVTANRVFNNFVSGVRSNLSEIPISVQYLTLGVGATPGIDFDAQFLDDRFFGS